MTEKEKSLNGIYYYPNDEELVRDRERTKGILFEYNHLNPLEYEKRKELMKKLIGKTENEFLIEQPFNCTYGYNTSVGKNFFANIDCKILDSAYITIGDNVLLAPNVCIITEGHAMDVEQRNAGLEYAYPVTIGNNVWIGANATILPNVTIGDNTIIGAGSVVTKDIPANSVAVGNPCKVIRSITEEDKIKIK